MRQVCERIKGVDVLLFGIIRQLLSSLKLIVITLRSESKASQRFCTDTWQL